MTSDEIARVCHEVNRAYCAALGDYSQARWEEAPSWQRESAVAGVRFHLDNPTAEPSASHEEWARVKRDAGWVHGAVKDERRKTHPCLVPFAELPREQQAKDMLFIVIVHSLKDDAPRLVEADLA